MSNLAFYLQTGYKLVSETETSYTIVKKQSIGIHLLLLLCTAGFGNIVYAILASKKTITIAK